jgi:hypothetical protein
MANLADYHVIDGVTEVLAEHHNSVIDSTIRGELSNIQSLAADKTLIDDDFALQVYTPTAARVVTLPAVATTNHPFYIVNSSATYALTVKNAGGTTISVIGVSSAGQFASDGAVWYTIAMPYAAPSTSGNVLTSNGSAWTSAVPATVTDVTLSTSDVTTNNATTSKHGFVVKATAPASGLINVVGIANSETGYTNKPLFSATTPSSVGSAGAVGTATTASRIDHVHSGLSYIAPSTSGNVLTSNGSAWTSATPTILDSGIYTPTITLGTNAAGANNNPSQYMRVGSVVTVSGMISGLDPTTTGDTIISLTLPIASNLAQLYQVGGTANSYTTTECAAIYGDTVSDLAVIRFIATNATSKNWWYTFTYRII